MTLSPLIVIIGCALSYLLISWQIYENKEILLPIWWYNRDLFVLSNKYVVFVFNGLKN